MFVETKREGEAPVIDAVGMLLLKAADVLERYGWVQREIGDTKRGFCAVGAINYARNKSLYGGGDFAAAAAAFGRLDAVLGRDLIKFNNAKGTTKAKVIAAMRRAAYA